MPPETDVETVAIESATPGVTDSQGAERDALIAAADAASGVVPPAKADKPAPSNGTDSPAAVPDDGMSKVARVLKEREAAQAARDEATKAKEEVATARAEIAAMRAEAENDRASAKADMERLQKLRSAPLSAIKELGWDTKQLVDEVMREGTPEWQAQKRYEAALDKQNAELAELKAWREEQKVASEKRDREAQAYGRQQVETKFLAAFPAESAARTLYEDSELVAKGHAIADAYREKSGGKVASIEDVRDYLEELAVKRLAAIRQEPGGVPASQAPAAAKVAHQPKANGPRALSGNAASERRTSPKPRHEWTPDEEYSALKAAAESAMK